MPDCAVRDREPSVIGSGTPVDYELSSRLDDSSVVVVDVSLDSSGSVRNLRLRRASRDSGRDASALAAAGSTLYSGRVARCRPVSSIFVYRARFSGERTAVITDPGS